MVVILQLVVVGLLVSFCRPWESQTASVTSNNFGKCPWLGLSETSTMQTEAGTFHVVSLKPSEEEREAYSRISETLTKSNPKLGLGIVKGVSQAAKWSNNTKNSWQLWPDHPRNDKVNCVRISKLTGETALEIYDQYKKEVEFYVVRAANALVHETGIVALPCGYFQPTEGCETMFKYIGRKWFNRCNDAFKAAKKQWPLYWPETADTNLLESFNNTGCKDAYKGQITRHRRVLVITAMWDHNYHHFLIDSVSRLVRHLPFLIANPDVKIHIRQHDQYAKESRAQKGGQLRKHILELLGLSAERLVSGVVLADEVFLPRAVKCNYPLASAYEIRLLAAALKARAAEMRPDPAMARDFYLDSPRKRVVLQHRPCATDKDCKLWRYWNRSTADAFAAALATTFQGYRVTVDNSNDPRIADCMACQVALYSHTQVLVGLHGAGLTNMMFMPPGGLVVEITGQYDGRMMPLCGYHGALAAVFGLHHYVYYYDWKGGEVLNVAQVAAEAAHFLRFLSK